MAPPPPVSSAIPPVLPPSVEEAYRRKCIQLRARTQTVAEANDAARIRLLRMRRGIEKMRLERAFLLEQVARRVKPNDDSSDGSPSPPPTPKQKPLRVKRGRRAPDFMQHEMSMNMSQDDGDALERDKETFLPRVNDNQYDDSHIDTSRVGKHIKPQNGFDVFANELAGPLSVNNRFKIKSGELDLKQLVLTKWREIGYEKQAEYINRFKDGDYAVPEGNGQASFARSNADGHGHGSDADDRREQQTGDVDMAEDDVE